MNKIFYFMILFLGLSFSLFSQTKRTKDTIYFDENNSTISKTIFESKCNAAVFNCSLKENDSVIIQKVNYNFYFGKISTDKFDKIRQHFNNKITLKINKNDNILIYHRDKLYRFREGSKADSTHNYKSEKDYQKYKARFLKHTENWNKSRSQLSNKVKYRYNTSTLFITNKNYGSELENKYFTWVIDNFSFFKNSYYQSIIMLKPNGDYFISYGQISDKNIMKILKSKDWTQYQQDFEKSIQTNFSVGYGIAKDLVIKEKRFIIE